MVPEEFTRRPIITLAKKGDFGNGEVSPSCPLQPKVLGTVLIKTIVAGTDVEWIREQGFRKGRSTTEQIFVLRNIVVQVVK